MVDFQERDTRRGLEEDEEPEEPDGAAPDAEPEDETAGGEADAGSDAESAEAADAAELAAEAAAEQAAEAAETDAGQDADDPEAPGEDDPDHTDVDGDHEDAGGDHAHHAHDVDSLGVAVVTVSSTRSLADDPAGDAIVETLDADGHEVVTRELIGDDLDGIQRSVNALAARDDVDVVVTTGGTGVTPDDVTPEAVEPLFDKELPGFGELFRELSRADVGSRVVATRAVGGVIGGVPVFCLPGSEAAVRLGVEEIVLPEAPHLAGLAMRHEE